MSAKKKTVKKSKEEITFLNLPKSKKVDGKMIPYISYSQHSSFNETSEEFYYQMILQYVFGIKMSSRFQIFATYGSHCGEYIETQGEKRGDLLSDKDCEIMDKIMKDFPEGSEYEREIWIDRGNYYILGFIDQWCPTDDAMCDVNDFKTGNISKKGAHYASPKYAQTTLYSFAETLKGLKIRDSFVTMLDRGGNPMSETNPTELHLTGEIKKILTPYSDERAQKILTEMDDTAVRLASLKTTYDKLKTLTFQL
jgi:hypothetical protein